MLLVVMFLPIAVAHNQAPATGDADVNVIAGGPRSARTCLEIVGLFACPSGGGVPATCLGPAPTLALCSEILPQEHVDLDRNAAFGGDRSGVSGRYVRSDDNSFVDLYGLSPITIGDLTLFPTGSVRNAAGAAFCDLEVLGPGNQVSGSDALLNEIVVDAAPGGEVVRNGLWDDGGIGGACHVGTYDYAPFNAPGCPNGKGVNAEDAVAGGSVWIGAACDVTRAASGSGSADPGVLVLCTENEVGQGATPAAIAGCASRFLSCTAPGNDCTVPPLIVCGTDNVLDTVNFGTGNAHGTPIVTFVGDPNCPTTSGTATVLVYDAVRVDFENPLAAFMSVASTGWIEQHV